MIRLIAAIDTKRGIATDKGIPWKLPGDTAYFEDQTATGIIVMGWATYNEFSAPLHNEINYVLTPDQGGMRSGFQPIGALDDLVQSHPADDVWIIGGAFVYAETIERADELFITQVLEDFHCTKFFPAFGAEFTRFAQSGDQEEGGVQYRFEKWRRTSSADSPGPRASGAAVRG